MKPHIKLKSSAYKGASGSRELASWAPARQSADAALLQGLPQLQARAYDLQRNYALTNGGHQLTVDNVIGTGLKISPNPNYTMLGQSAEWAAQWRRDVKQQFENWANDDDAHIDASRRYTLAGLFALSFKSYLLTGEILASAEWLPRKFSDYATAIQLIDPMRLENPNVTMDSETLRGGVYLGRLGNPVAYSIRFGNDLHYTGYAQQSWRKINRYNQFGRKNIFHHFDADRPGQSRGVSGLATVLAKSKMLEKFQDHALESAIVNSMYAAYIKSSMPQLDVAGALGSEGNTGVSSYMQDKAQYYEENSDLVTLNGVRVPHLYPDEDLVFTSNNHPSPNFEQFERAMIRHLAAGLNISYEQLARDYKDTNYSGARAALLESWKFFTGKRVNVAGKFGSWIFGLWLEEAIDRGRVEVPSVPGQTPIEYFWQNKAALCRATWTGNAKGHIDPLKETRADVEEINNGLSTLEEKAANRGMDWEDVARQRIEEIAFIRNQAAAAGLTLADLNQTAANTLIMTDGEQ